MISIPKEKGYLTDCNVVMGTEYLKNLFNSKEQTEQICLEAVKQNGDALQYVKDRNMLIKVIDKINKGD